MKKWEIGLIVVLLIGLGVVTFLLVRSNSELGQTHSDLSRTSDELVQRNSDLAHAKGDLAQTGSDLASRSNELAQSQSQAEELKYAVYSAETKSAGQDKTISDLQFYLSDTNGKISSLQTNLSKSQSDVKAQQIINASLSTELKKVEDPRHFATVAELTDWLAQDDTNKVYANERPSIRGYILQIRALRAGFLLPVMISYENNTLYFDNIAIIGDSIYDVDSSDDAIYKVLSGMQPVPSHPLPLP
jgi:septal ring factor EnvC (AmiA/AmiB activator)